MQQWGSSEISTMNKKLLLGLALVCSLAFAQRFPVVRFNSTPTPEPPSAPTGLSPANGATDLIITSLLQWDAVSDATYYGVYLCPGTTCDPVLITITTETSYDPSLNYGNSYRFRISAGNSNGATLSDIYTFTTGPEFSFSTEHPVIWLTPTVLSGLADKVAANDTDWLELKAEADALLTKTVAPYDRYATPAGSIYYAYEGGGWYSAIISLSLAYVATGDTAYASKAKEVIDVINANGNTPVIVDSGYPYRSVATAMALAYDWLYDYLDVSTKSSMILTINGYFSLLSTGGGGLYIQLNGNNNYFGGYVLGMGLCGLATYGDNPNAATINSFISNWWDNYAIQAFIGTGAGGQVMESYNYGPNHILRLLRYANAIKTATGSDIYSVYSDKLITSMFYNLKPNRWQSTDEGDFSGDYVGIMGKNFPLYLSFIDSSDQGAKALFVYNNMEPTPSSSANTHVQAAKAWERFLFKSPSRTPVDYRMTEPLYYKSAGDNHLFVRSDWTDNAIWASFAGGAAIAADHQSRAAGHIAIARGNDSLLVQVGQWKGESGFGGQPQTMDRRNSMLNTLFTDGACAVINSTYAGGQGWYGSNDTVLKYESGSNYNYMKSELSTAYYRKNQVVNDRDVRYWQRNFVRLGDNVFVVFDRVQMRLDSFIKEFRFHLHKQATNTSTDGVVKSELNSSALFVKPVYPSTVNMQLANADNAVVNQVVKLTDTITSTDFSPLTVLIADASTAEMPPTVTIDTTGMIGVFIGQAQPKVMMFSKDGNAQSSATYQITAGNGVTVTHLLVDMAPGSHALTGAVEASATASAQGVMSFTSTGTGSAQTITVGE